MAKLTNDEMEARVRAFMHKIIDTIYDEAEAIGEPVADVAQMVHAIASATYDAARIGLTRDVFKPMLTQIYEAKVSESERLKRDLAKKIAQPEAPRAAD